MRSYRHYMAQWPDTLNAYEYFLGDRISEGDGDRTAIRFADETFSYSQIDALTAGFANALRDVGATRGERVLMVMNDSPAFAACLLGVFNIGGVAVMLNPGLNPEALSTIVARSRGCRSCPCSSWPR